VPCATEKAVAGITVKEIKQGADRKTSELRLLHHKIAFMECQASKSLPSDVYGYQTIIYDPVRRKKKSIQP
jgi:hypothetical protein